MGVLHFMLMPSFQVGNGQGPKHTCPPSRWVMVVMELLEGAVTWQSSMHHPTDMLREAVKKLHGAGWVHGDIRGTNVLVSNERQVFLPCVSDWLFYDSYWFYDISVSYWLF